MSPFDPLTSHYKIGVKAMLQGRVVPLLGAGVNLAGRAEDQAWAEGSQFLPSGGELAAHLADEFGYPDDIDGHDLVRVSQYVEVMAGSAPLYDTLHQVFEATSTPTVLHRFLARLPKTFRDRGQTPKFQVIVTTNYDDALETAFRGEEEPFDVVSYIAEGEEQGHFLHCPPDEEARVIDIPNEYAGLPVDERGNPQERTVILKIHGAVDRDDPSRDSYVITEDNYIDYLTRSEISSLVPASLVAKLKNSHLLFLGYSMRDWNLRVILHRIWGEQKLNFASWAIQLHPDPMEQQFWNLRGVQIFDVSLADYVTAMDEQLAEAGAKATDK
ncbi:MAG: SIR2 family protein [Actinomycetota bacterium]|nr:SIR2 family protein [Actinomycetota bacterium]